MTCETDLLTPRTPCVACPDPDDVMFIHPTQVSATHRTVLDNHSELLQCLIDRCLVEQGEIAERYVQTFVEGDWVGGTTITIPVATHGKGTDPIVTIREGAAAPFKDAGVDDVSVDAVGNITLTVTVAFDGKVIIM